jgi:hypothetical protein
MLKAATVYIQGFEDFENRSGRNARAHGPADDLKVFLAGLEQIEDVVEKCVLFGEFALKQAKVAAIEFNPENRPMQMLDPPRPQVSGPVSFHPVSDTVFAQVATRFLTLDPLVAVLVIAAIHVNALRGDRPVPVADS